MSAIKFSKQVFQNLQALIDLNDRDKYISEIEKNDNIPNYYASDMGRLVLAAELEQPVFAEEGLIEYDFYSICRKEHDLRCQVGHVLSNLESRGSVDYTPFSNNAFATVMVVDKKGLNLPKNPPAQVKFQLPSLESRQGLNLINYGAKSGQLLCDHFFYANEHVPKARKFGSGCFIDHNKVLTAAHVLKQAWREGVAPSDLIFIRSHFSWGKSNDVKVYPHQIYVLNQSDLIDNTRIMNSESTDIAWVEVRPYYVQDNSGPVYKGAHNGFYKKPLTTEPVVRTYVLGHGFGLPMKLSFKGLVTGVGPNNTGEFYCDVNILPGSSGSPIFHADTHELIGVVSGLHEIHTKYFADGGCVTPVINMQDDLSGVATQAIPFVQNI